MGRVKKKYFYRYVVKRGGRTYYKSNIISYACGMADDVRGIVIDVILSKVVYKSKDKSE